MEKELREITITDEEGNEIIVNVLKEFNHKDKEYVVLYEDCDCNEEDDTEDEEKETDNDALSEDAQGDAEDDFEDMGQCECDMNVFIMQVEKDNEKETFVEITDDKLMDELVEVASKILYEN